MRPHRYEDLGQKDLSVGGAGGSYAGDREVALHVLSMHTAAPPAREGERREIFITGARAEDVLGGLRQAQRSCDGVGASLESVVSETGFTGCHRLAVGARLLRDPIVPGQRAQPRLPALSVDGCGRPALQVGQGPVEQICQRRTGRECQAEDEPQPPSPAADSPRVSGCGALQISDRIFS